MLATGRALEQYHGGAMSRRVTALVTAGVRLTGGITPGTVFMPLHFAEAAANLLTHAALDIADVDVGGNIGAKLQIDQANADKRIAQAKAEERRAMAIALEQEMRARVVEAEAEVPRAMAEAFRQGNLGIMDYDRMKNVQADTEMRESIAGASEEPPGTQRK